MFCARNLPNQILTDSVLRANAATQRFQHWPSFTNFWPVGAADMDSEQQRIIQEMLRRFCQEEKCEGNLQYGPGEEFVISRTYSFSNGESWVWIKGSFDYVTGYISGWLNGKVELRLSDDTE